MEDHERNWLIRIMWVALCAGLAQVALCANAAPPQAPRPPQFPASPQALSAPSPAPRVAPCHGETKDGWTYNAEWGQWWRYRPSAPEVAPPQARPFRAGPVSHAGHNCPNCRTEQRIQSGRYGRGHTHTCPNCATVWYH